LVDGLTKLEAIQHARENQMNRKMLLAMARDVRVISKLANRLRSHNMPRWVTLRSKKTRISANTGYLCTGAHGSQRTRLSRLQGLSFQHLHPWRYGVLVKALSHCRASAGRHQTCATKSSNRSTLPSWYKFKGRKSAGFARWTKHHTFAQVTDLYGFRVIVIIDQLLHRHGRAASAV
jgi:GTP pyrophosphokinase